MSNKKRGTVLFVFVLLGEQRLLSVVHVSSVSFLLMKEPKGEGNWHGSRSSTT